MKILEEKRKALILKFNKESSLCNKNKLFGNSDLINLLKKITDTEELISNSYECEECEGEGSINCECDCPHCEKEYCCDKCGGDGYLSK